MLPGRRERHSVRYVCNSVRACFVVIFVEECKISSNRLSWRKLSVKFLTKYLVALKEISVNLSRCYAVELRLSFR